MKLEVECANAAKRFPEEEQGALAGSLVEVQTALEVARQAGYVPEEEFQRLDAIATETAKTVWGLLRKLSVTPARLPVS